MNSRIIHIANTLKNRFLNESDSLNELSIFLCGGSGAEEEKYRRQLGEQISKISSKYKYSVYYPEDMFIELMLGHQKHDLLTLENLLADGANAVAILLQSPGTFTELGAFANYKKLQDKLIVIINPKYARKKSFINLGPVRYLRTKTKSKVIYLPMDDSNVNKLVKKIADATRDVARHSSPIRKLSNPISSYRFYLALIYIFDPIPKHAILAISRALETCKEGIVVTAAETVTNSLINERKISSASDELSITPKGSDELIYGNKTRRRARDVLSFLTGLRLEALNLTLRKNRKRIWGEAGGS